MDYTSIGFDQFLQKPIATPTFGGELDSLTAEQLIQDLPASKLSLGKITSRDGKMILDMDNSKIYFSDGNRNRVELGNNLNGFGINVYDANGNLVVESGDKSSLEGSSIATESIDFTKINFNNFVKKSGLYYVNDFNIPINTVGIVRTAFSRPQASILLAMPRVSIYDGGPIEANEIESKNTIFSDIFRFISYQQSKNNYVRTVTSLHNFTASAETVSYRSDFIYIGI